MNYKKILHISYIFIFIYFMLDIVLYLKLGQYKKYYLNMDSLYGQSLNYISRNFIGKDYFTEKENSIFVEPPIFNVNNFNCVTFVEIVLGFCISNNFNELDENLKRIKYKNGNIDFLSRNHFITTDWVPNNYLLLKDITKNITKDYKTKIVKIDKKSWIIKNFKEYYDFLKLNNQLQKLDDFKVIEQKIDYISSDFILNNDEFIKNLPDESIVFIIKDLENIKDKIGTELDVTHAGFLFKERNKFYRYFNNLNEYNLTFRHASSAKNKIVNVDFKKYIKNSKKVQGIIILTLNKNYE